MQTIQLAGTSLTVSRACLGTMTFGAQAEEPEAARMIGMAVDAGVNFLDTANIYANGESERITGAALGARRKDVVLASKVGGKTDAHPAGLTRALILGAIEQSLRRLGTDYLDLYYLHIPDRATPLEESLAAMDDLVRQGKVRYVATSNHASWQECRMHWISEKHGYGPPVVSQPMYNVLARRIEDEYLPFCREFGVSTVAYNPLAGGLLSGKHNFSAPIAGTRFDANQMYQDRYWNQRNFEAVSLLAETAQREGRTLVSLALNWMIHHTAVTCIILGASKPEQLTQNLQSLEEGRLSEDTLRVCDEVWAMLKGSAPKYNR